MAMINNFLGRRWRNKPVENSTKDAYKEASGDQYCREVLILDGHRDIVRLIARVDYERFVTAGDDGTAILWNAVTGHRECTLEGHGHPITCLLVLEQDCMLLTGSSDKTIRVWDLSAKFSGDRCLKVLKDHGSAVKCLVKLDMDMFCSGGADLCLWHKTGTLLSKIERHFDKPSIHSMLQVHGRHFCVITASDFPSLAVHDVIKVPGSDKYELNFAHDLARHREEIQCLTKVSDSSFASASLDGAIIFWSTNSFSAVRQFNYIENYQKRNFPDRVWQIIVMEERYLFASVSNGFKIFDVIASEDNQGCPKLLACYLNAHQLYITHMELIEDQSVLVTCSADNTIRLWGSSSSHHSSSDSVRPSTKSAMERFLGRKPKSPAGYPNLLGELRAHTSPVLMVCNMTPHGLVTSGVDTKVLLWKESETESSLRFQRAVTHLTNTAAL